MIKKEIMDAFNEQLTKEMYSSNLYLAMAGYFKSINLPGFANWMLVQAKEENIHAMLFFNYILDRGGEVKIDGFVSNTRKVLTLADLEKAMKKN